MENIGHVIAVAERIIGVNSEPYTIGEERVTIGTSLGISLYPDDGETVEELINGADVAMYRSKRDGRNRYNLFNPDVLGAS